MAALGRDSDDWHIKNACPCCMYELDNEVPLAHRILTTMDGNNSLKLVDDSFRRGTQREDSRRGRAPKWLSAPYIDTFKDEVPSRAKHGGIGSSDSAGGPVPAADVDIDDDDAAWLDAEVGTENDGRFKKTTLDVDNPVPNIPPTTCTSRWKNAGPEGQKRMFSMYLITGLFICLCRHGILLMMCDMIQSGEL